MSMKKIFLKTLFLVLLLLIFSYMVIEKQIPNAVGRRSILSDVSDTGISVIGFVFLFPSFVFTVLSMCMPEKKMIDFCSYMFSGFSALFCLIAGVVAMFTFGQYLYVPIVLLVTTAITLCLSIVFVLKTLKEENNQKENTNNIEL